MLRHQLVLLDDLDDLAAAASVLHEAKRSAEGALARHAATSDRRSTVAAGAGAQGHAIPTVEAAVHHAVASSAAALHADALGRLVFLFYTRRVDPLGDFTSDQIGEALLRRGVSASASVGKSRGAGAGAPGVALAPKCPSTSTLRELFGSAAGDAPLAGSKPPEGTIGSAGTAESTGSSAPAPGRTMPRRGKKRFPWHPALQWGLQALVSVYTAVPPGSFAGLAVDICRAVEVAIRRDARAMESSDPFGSVLLVVSHLLRVREQVGSMLAQGGNATAADASVGAEGGDESATRRRQAASSGPTTA